MKHIVFLLFIFSSFTNVFAQTDSITAPALNFSDSIASRNMELLDRLVNSQNIEREANRYKMYSTENIYNFLKLDTQTGRIEQVQWSLDDKKEFSTTLNARDLSLSYTPMNSFELYPTQNMYQFILLDKATGRTWHVQWGLEPKKRWIQRIY